ncbi:hypothetical protein Tco_1512129, partial [Tanacetum coccineum]
KYKDVAELKECLTYYALSNGYSIWFERCSLDVLIAVCGQRPSTLKEPSVAPAVFKLVITKKGCKAPTVQKLVMEKKKAGRPTKTDATDVGGSVILLGGSGVGRSGSGVGMSGSGVGMSGRGLGRSGRGVGRPANEHDDGIDVGGSANEFVGSASGVGGSVQVVMVGVLPTGSSYRPRKQNVRRGFARWFGNDDSGGVTYDMDADTQGNQTSNQVIPSVQGSQTEMEIPTQEMPSQATNDVPPDVPRQAKQRPIVPRQMLPNDRIIKRNLARKVHGHKKLL